MSNYTKGPWKVRAGKVWHHRHDDRPIATVHLAGGTQAEMQENLELIGAAPELLNTLEEIRDLLHDHPQVDTGNSKVHYCYHRAQAAINRAKGIH